MPWGDALYRLPHRALFETLRLGEGEGDDTTRADDEVELPLLEEENEPARRV